MRRYNGVKLAITGNQMQHLTIAFLGTGLMGFPMAQNLLVAGHRVKAWNRTLAKAQPLAEFGADICATAADAVTDADVVISMLTDGAATQAVLDETPLQIKLPKGSVWVEMASIKPEQARAQAQMLAGHGVAHLDAPVSGGTAGAKAATLAIMAGGDAGVFGRLQHILSAMGTPVHVGPSGAGQLAKLANQAIVAITIGAVAEAMLMLEQGGADPAAVRTALKGGFADSTILQQHGARMTTRNFTPGGLAALQLKDINNGLEQATKHGLTLPFLQAAQARFARLVNELDGAGLDHSALFLELLDQNDLNNP